jgi:hypothetical protein
MFQMSKWVMWTHFKHLSFNRFSWYKELFNSLDFDPCNCFLHSRIHQDSNSQGGSSFGSVKVHSLTLSFTLGLLFLAHNIANLYLGQEPKARVATCTMHPMCFDTKHQIFVLSNRETMFAFKFHLNFNGPPTNKKRSTYFLCFNNLQCNFLKYLVCCYSG